MITTAFTVLMLYSAVFGAVLTLLWAAWRLSGLHRHTNFALSRSLLIGSVLFAAAASALPLIIGPHSVPVQVTVVSRDTVPVQTIATVGAAEAEFTEAGPTLSLGDLTAIYAIGLLLSAIGMTGSLIYVWSVIGRSRPTPQAGVRLRRNASTVPFSWGHWIVMSEADYTTNLRAMLAHEQVHRSQAHWLDLLLLRAAECLTWYLPTVRLMRRDLIQCHEYAADAGAIAAGIEAESYQMMLIERASGRRLRSSLVNSFNFSSIKNRITMMQRKPSAASAWTRALVLLPAAAIAIAAVTSPALANAVGNAIPAPAPTPLPTAASTPAPTPVQATDDSTDEIFNVTEVMPEFKGGTNSLYKYLSENIRYPEDAAQANIQGRVIVQFVVEKDGSVSNVKVFRGVHPSLDAEALRVTNSIPAGSFSPGTMNGKPVSVWFTLPISFKLYSEPAKPEPEPEITPDVEATYPGGNDAMFQALSMRIRYPEEAALNDIQGRVTVSFRVNEEGVVNQVKLIKGKHPALDAEAMRVVTTLTGFTPAMKDGKPVATWVTLPLTFRISGDEEPAPNAYKATPAFYGAISSSARYPREAAEKGITGTAYVYLRIKDNGEASAPVVKESCWHRMDSSTPQKVNCPDLDRAATEAVSKAARHITTPGLYAIPMTFRLSGLDNVAFKRFDNFDNPTLLDEVIVTGSYK